MGVSPGGILVSVARGALHNDVGRERNLLQVGVLRPVSVESCFYRTRRHPESSAHVLRMQLSELSPARTVTWMNVRVSLVLGGALSELS